MASTANYAATPLSAVVQVSAANPNRDGTGALVTLLNGGANGSRIDDFVIKAVGTVTAGAIRFYLSVDAGVTNRLILEVPVTATAATISTATWAATYLEQAWQLENPNTRISVSTEKAEAFNIAILRGGSF